MAPSVAVSANIIHNVTTTPFMILQVSRKHVELCRVHNLHPPTTSDLASICAGLGALKVLMVEAGKADLYQRIHLLVPEQNLQHAFGEDAFMSRLI